MLIRFSDVRDGYSSHLTIRPIGPTIGAEISGLDLREPLNEALSDTLKTLLHQYKVLFFRDQELTRDQHVALGRAFGDLETHPLHGDPKHPEIVRLDSAEVRNSRPYYGRAAAQSHADTSSRVTPRPPRLFVVSSFRTLAATRYGLTRPRHMPA